MSDGALLKTYKRLDVDLVRGEGVYVYDSEGRRFLDLYAGHAVTSTGHCHPRVVKAIQEQAGRLIFYSNVAGLPLRDRAAARLIRHAPPGLTKVLFANSGAEANENALKMARRHTGRTAVVAMEGGFHGRTAGAMSVTGIEKYRAMSAPLLPQVRFVPFGDRAAAEKAIDGSVAAVLLEPIQSMAGVRMGPSGYYAALREACDRAGALLVYDEVQTGIGRTGRMFFAGHEGAVPDLITLAKGIASGVPLSAVLVRDRIAERIGYGEYGTTFGAGPLAMAALEATLDVIETERLLDNVVQVSARLVGGLRALPGVEEVRGMGFLLGFRTKADAARLQGELRARGILVGTSDEPGVLRLLPPLLLGADHVAAFLDALPPALAAATR